MRTVYDVQQLLKKYGTIIHLGNRLWDIELMMIELKQLEEVGVLDRETFIQAMLVLKREHHDEEKRQEEK